MCVKLYRIKLRFTIMYIIFNLTVIYRIKKINKNKSMENILL